MANIINSFPTINQYDRKYKRYGDFGNKRSACSVFSLIAAYRFMKQDIPKTTEDQVRDHLQNLDQGIYHFVDRKLSGSITFGKLLQMQTQHTDNNVQGTSVEMIKQDIVGYDCMFPDESALAEGDRYAVIFLKNYNFFVVLVHKTDCGVVYSVRDCHEKKQVDMIGINNIKMYLNNTYHFDHAIDLDGYTDADLDNFSNIEFLQIMQPFNIKLDMTKWLFQTEKEVKKNIETDEFEIYYEDSSDEDVPADGDISDDDDIIANGKKNIQYDADLQMAMALQQSELGNEGAIDGVNNNKFNSEELDLAQIMAQIAQLESKGKM